MSPDRAALEATSILTLGATGAIDGQPFTLIGRRCFRGRRGNVWNEWTLSDVPHFLSESAGSFTLYREGSLLSPSDVWMPGERIPWLIVERGSATVLAEWGEVEPCPAEYDFVDLLSVGAARRASLVDDQVFVGAAVDPHMLGLVVSREPPRLVATPNVSPPSGLTLWLEVGDRGTLDGVEYRVLGVVARRGSDDARWEEYCMYSACVGVRWLVVADGHWSYVAPVETGAAATDVELSSLAIVEWATGELPWEVSIGEHAFQLESGALTQERTRDEVSWSRAVPLAPDAVASAFNKRALPRPK